jgi:ribonuclease HI
MQNKHRGDGGTSNSPSLSFQNDEVVTIYTDGGCDPLTKQGGWAAILFASSLPVPFKGSGNLVRTTNNRAELQAVIKALECMQSPTRVKLVSDSRYVVDSLAERLPRWKAQGWRAGSGRHKRDLKNVDLWKRLDVLIEPHTITYEWVQGHSGNVWNEECDRMASEAMRRFDHW